jgi:hypothetical protein
MRGKEHFPLMERNPEQQTNAYMLNGRVQRRRRFISGPHHLYLASCSCISQLARFTLSSQISIYPTGNAKTITWILAANKTI